MAKNLSKTTISEIAIQTILRFPFIILCSIIGSFAMIIFVGYDEYGENTNDIFYLVRLGWACGLGIPFLFALNILCQTIRNPIIDIFVRLFGIALIFVAYLVLPKTYEQWNGFFYAKIISVLIVLLLICTFLPFWRKDHTANFWKYNISLFINSVFSILYCTVFFAGTSTAIYLLDGLLAISIPEARYLQVGIAIFGVLGIWYFLSLLPYEYQQKEDLYMPKGLTLFNQFVLIPLLFIYGLILYGIALKILIDWELPANRISPLVLGFSIIGILTFFFIYPLRKKHSKGWTRVFKNSFFITLLPLLALHFVVLARRIVDYGFTENRYFSLLLGLWLFGLSVYFILNKKGHLISIPISLCVVILFGIFFPYFNAFSVTERGQLDELYSILTDQKVLTNDTLPKEVILPNYKIQRIKNIIFYLEKRDRLDAVKPLFGSQFASLKSQDRLNAYQLNKRFKDSLIADQKIMRFHSPNLHIDIRSFEHFFPFSIENRVVNLGSQNSDLKNTPLYFGDKKIRVNLESFSDSLISTYFNTNDKKLDSIAFQYIDHDRLARIYFKTLVYKVDKKIDLIEASGFVFVKKLPIDTLLTSHLINGENLLR